MIKDLLIPQVRFTKFSDNWELNELGELANRYDNLRVPVTASDRISGKTPYYGANGIQDFVDGFTHEGEFVLVAEDGANDLKNYPVQYVNGRIWVNNHAHVLQTKNNVANNMFLKYVISRANIEPYLVGGGRAKLNAEIMMKIEFAIPNYEEQEKIGLYLKKFDNLLSFEQKKYDKLITIKKSLLENFVPKEDNKVPKIRFKGFSSDWKNCKFTDEVTLYSGLTYSPDNIVETDGTLVLRSSNVQNGEICLGDNVYVANDFINSNNVEIGDIIVVVRNGSRALIGKHAQIKRKMANTVIGAFMTGIKYEYSGFINALLNTTKFETEIQRNMGATINQITNGAFNNMYFSFPQDAEKERIGKFFNKLDDLISLRRQKIEKLKTLKKALLNKMFI